METEAHKLLDAVEEEGAEGAEKAAPVHHSETAMRHMEEYDTIKSTIGELHEKIEVEAGSITQDQKYYAEFFQGVKSFKPWMDEAEKVANAPLHKPETLEDAKKLMETTIAFEAGCQENKSNLDSAVDSKSKMEKQTKSDTEVETLTTNLTETICKISGDVKPDVSQLEQIFTSFRTLNERSKKLVKLLLEI